MKNIPDINNVRERAISNILYSMEHCMDFEKEIYQEYLDNINKGVQKCINNHQLQFVLYGGAPTGCLPGLIEALLLLQGYCVEKVPNDGYGNKYLISIFDVNNYKYNVNK